MNRTTPDKFVYDETTEILTSLELVALEAEIATQHTQHWKWVIVGVHASIQSAMVLALTGTTPFSVLERPVELAQTSSLNFYDRGVAEVKLGQKLLKFLELYKRIRKIEFMGRYVNSRVYNPNSDQNARIKQLNTLRNTFIHFRPVTLFLSVNDLPAFCFKSLEVVQFLIYESNNIWIDNENIKVGIEDAFKRIYFALSANQK